MKQYIDKDALVAEIERRIKERDFQMKSGCWISSTYMYEDLLDFLDTLEVKEVDLEKELDYNDYMNFFKEHPDYSNGDWGFEETWAFGQYCYELGLKLQKEE